MMVGFNNKKINAIKTLGERLQAHRLECGLSLEQIANETQININYLRAIENDQYDKLPPDVYTKNFLQRHAEFLNLNPDTVFEIFQQEKSLYFKTQKKIIKKKDKQSKLQTAFNFFLNPHFIKYALVLLIIALLLVYIGWGINKIFTPPKLVINEPAKSFITTDRQIWIKGETDKEVLLTINGQEIISDKHGQFSNQLDLQKGLNMIKITAKKKHSKEKVEYLKIIVEDSADLSKIN